MVGEKSCVEVGLEAHEPDRWVIVDRTELGSKVLQDIFILEKEHRDLAFEHSLLFLREEPGHAIHEDRPLRPAPDLMQVVEKLLVAESKDRLVGLDHVPLVARVDMDTKVNHFLVKGFCFREMGGRDQMHLHPEVKPRKNLVVEFRPCASVEAGKPIDEDPGEQWHALQ